MMNAYEDKIKRFKWEKHSLCGVVDRQQRELDEYRRQMNYDHDEVTHPVPTTNIPPALTPFIPSFI
jgi:hypothetical protein